MKQEHPTPDFKKTDGLIPVIAQDWKSSEVLMLAYMNQEAYELTLKEKRAVYFSRSRNRLWRKGEESGNIQRVKEVLIDCDQDTLIIKVEQVGGAACHQGYRSCFFRKIDEDKLCTIATPIFDPKEVYSSKKSH